MKKRNRDLESAVDEILYYFWDPCTISKDEGWFINGRDEYYSYLPEIVTLLKSGATKKKLQKHFAALYEKNFLVKEIQENKTTLDTWEAVSELLIQAYKKYA